jgi:hypothetical protein
VSVKIRTFSRSSTASKGDDGISVVNQDESTTARNGHLDPPVGDPVLAHDRTNLGPSVFGVAQSGISLSRKSAESIRSTRGARVEANAANPESSTCLLVDKWEKLRLAHYQDAGDLKYLLQHP